MKYQPDEIAHKKLKHILLSGITERSCAPAYRLADKEGFVNKLVCCGVDA